MEVQRVQRDTREEPAHAHVLYQLDAVPLEFTCICSSHQPYHYPHVTGEEIEVW